jgi:hypothetical protein
MSHQPDMPPLAPHDLVLAYDRYAAALWRGEETSAKVFAVWLERHWTGQAPPEPEDAPDAASVLGAAGAGIRWYARGKGVLGYVTGRAGCYQVTADDAVPVIAAPWESPGSAASAVSGERPREAMAREDTLVRLDPARDKSTGRTKRPAPARPLSAAYSPGSDPLAIGTPTMLPHSVQEPS